jgi:hypothetical protein
VTQVFTGHYSPYLDCNLIDSPGLGDRNIPINQWLEIYNTSFKKEYPSVDLILLVIEKNERVSTKEIVSFSVL